MILVKTIRRYHLLSLGCPKNEVDSESMSALLREAGYVFASQPKQADVLIVNTCAFIEAAVEEAIDAILDLAEAKQPGAFLIVAGCLTQRYRGEIFDELPEVDAIIGTADYSRIVHLLKRLEAGESLRSELPGPPGSLIHLDARRVPAAPRGTYAYVKIAEGCSNACAYCAIPRIRGPLRSRDPQAIINEARYLVEGGVRELILVAQDTTRYGWDLPGKPGLAGLLRQLVSDVPDLELIRCLYFYADALSDELIGELAANPKAAHYVDLPIQHASNAVLRRMRRHETIELIEGKIRTLRERIPDVIIRTTVMTGFPGESEEDFQILSDFVRKIRFDRLGCFVFSAEEGTAAARMPDQVPYEIAEARAAKIMEIQRSIALESNETRIGEVTRVLLEGVDEHGILFQGRSYGEAPDIDPLIYVAASTPDLAIGSRPAVRIVEARPFELIGVSLDESAE